MTRVLLAVLLALTTSTWAAPILILPTVGGDMEGGSLTGNNVLHCVTYVSPLTATFTKMAARFINGSGTIGFAIYPDSNSGTVLGQMSGTASSITATGLTVSLVGGTRYRVCVCGSVATGLTYIAVAAPAGTGTIPDLLNASTFTTTMGLGASVCAAGVPPSTTGAITANTAFKLPVILLE